MPFANPTGYGLCETGRMTDAISKLKPSRRLRPGSGREVRLIRLAWLAGWTVADIATLLGESARTVSRRLAGHRLMEEAAPGEMERLVLAVMQDTVAEGLVGGSDLKELVVMFQKLAGTVRVIQAVEKAADCAGTEDEDEDWRESALEEIERMVRMDSGIETKAARSSQSGPDKRPARRCSDDAGGTRVSCPGAGYTGAAAGPCANVVAFGRAWRGQDAGGGRMGPLGSVAGGLLPGGAGGADFFGCARSDDRRAERADCDGHAGGRPAGVATLPPPA